MTGSVTLATRPPKGGRRLLWLLLTLFALPFATVAALYAFGWRPTGSGSHGEIVAGTAPLPFAELHAASGGPKPADALAGRWILVVAAPDSCSRACREQLDLTRRLHVALYKNMPRVRRLLLTPAPGDDPSLPEIRAAWPDLVVARSDHPHWRALLAAIPTGEVRVYVVDPEGRPVLRYASGYDARGALRDVERLLKLSWIG